MKYVFEWRKDRKLGATEGNIIREEIKELETDEQARQYAIDNGADYCWDAPADRNPGEIYSRRD